MAHDGSFYWALGAAEEGSTAGAGEVSALIAEVGRVVAWPAAPSGGLGQGRYIVNAHRGVRKIYSSPGPHIIRTGAKGTNGWDFLYLDSTCNSKILVWTNFIHRFIFFILQGIFLLFFQIIYCKLDPKFQLGH